VRPQALLLVAGAAALGCSGAANGMTPGTGGGGGTGGSAGTAGGAGGSGGGAPFMAFAPCTDQTSYVASATTVMFGGGVGFAYAPQCLKVPAGTTVTFSGDFATHPLIPSAMRGNTTSNPIMATSSGTSAPFTFPNAGFYAYLCMFHGSDDGSFMSGVIWVQ
jgi:plastocyanin